LVKADFTLVTTSTGIQPVLVSIYGEPILKGNGSIELEPGTYVVESEQARGASKGSFQGKESKAGYTITLDSSAASLARINRAKEAIDAIPDVVEYTSLYLELIQTARMYHDELTTSEKLEVSDQKITDAY